LGGTPTFRHGTERGVTSDLGIQNYPAISGDRIVWKDYRLNPLGGGTHEAVIYLYDLATGTERQITGPYELNIGGDLHISGDKVVWGDGSMGIRLYDLATDTERQIARGFTPAISGDRMVWVDFRNMDWPCNPALDPSCQFVLNSDIYLYDTATDTERQITSDSRLQQYPAISGDKIVWEDDRNGNWDIYLYDLATDTERQITSDPYDQRDPAVSGDKIVWEDSRNRVPSSDEPGSCATDPESCPRTANWDIYLYDLATDTEQRITGHRWKQQDPAISCDTVVWQDYRNGVSKIYSSEIPNVNCPPITRILDPDVNDDGNVDLMNDIFGTAFAFGTDSAVHDITGDGVVDLMNDILGVAGSFGLDWPPTNVKEGRLLNFYVKGTDPDGDSLTFEVTDLPLGATFTNPDGDDADYRREFRWTPSDDQAGDYSVTFTATDGDLGEVEALPTELPITVRDVP